MLRIRPRLTVDDNTEYDPKFAVTGDLNSDLSVQPIGGVTAKIRGATKAKCNIVAVPYANAKGLADLFVSGDQLLKGAALNALQIADRVFAARPTTV